MVSMRSPIPAEERIPPVSRVIAEALVLRQGPRRIVTRATCLGLSPVTDPSRSRRLCCFGT